MPPRSRDEIGEAEAVSATSRERAVVAAPCRRAYPDLQAIYLFGSRASGAPRPHSDFDLALLLPPELARGAECLPLSELRPVLERELGREVDLVNLRIAPTVFAKEIVATGERIDCSDPAAADDFEALTFSLYQELNVERASAGDAFRSDFSREDAAVMNVVRACEATIDLTNVYSRRVWTICWNAANSCAGPAREVEAGRAPGARIALGGAWILSGSSSSSGSIEFR